MSISVWNLEKAFPSGRGQVRAIIATNDVRGLARYYEAGDSGAFCIVLIDGTTQAYDLAKFAGTHATVRRSHKTRRREFVRDVGALLTLLSICCDDTNGRCAGNLRLVILHPQA